MVMQKRPIAHLENRHVFAKGVVKTWRRPPEGDVAILLKHVSLTDYETDKKKLAPVLDHCWIWAQDVAWEVMYDMHITFREHFTLLDEVHCVCRVEGYTRANGTRDYGLRLVNWFPVSTSQRDELRKTYACMAKSYKKGRSQNTGKPVTLEDLRSSVFSLTLLDLKMEDWRCHGNTLRQARTQLKLNIAHLKGYLTPILGEKTVQVEIDSHMRYQAIPDIEGLLKRPVNWDALSYTLATPSLAAGEAIAMKPKPFNLPEDLLHESELKPQEAFWFKVLLTKDRQSQADIAARKKAARF